MVLKDKNKRTKSRRYMKTRIENTEKFYVARDNDGRLFKFEYRNTMRPWQAPCKHINAWPFNGNFYVTGSDYQPKKGEEIDSSLYPEVTYENSPVLIEE